MEQPQAAPASDQERIGRLEERIGSLLTLVAETRQDQKAMAETVARASGGLRVLVLLGGLAGVAGLARAVTTWAGGWLPHGQ
jgi:hypothetical protein